MRRLLRSAALRPRLTMTLPDGSQCPIPATCNNHICEDGETAINCSADCEAIQCNHDGVCQIDIGEECINCADCSCRQQSSCGNMLCESEPALYDNPESPESCPQDCLVALPSEGQSAEEGGYQCTVPGRIPAHSDWLLLAAGAAGLIAWRRRRDD